MKVKNFAGFMKARRLNENDNVTGGWDNEEGEDYGYYGANPEDDDLGEEDGDVDTEGAEGEEGEEELTLEGLAAMVKDLEERIKKLEPEEEEGEGEEAEGEGEEAEGEEAPATEEK